MKITIITVSYNAVNTIEKTILSVINQNYSNIEYCVVDGMSSDGTLNILEKYKKKIDILTVESDNGVYHAMNKGLELATGDVIGFLNADDFFYNDSVLSLVKKSFEENENLDIVYGNVKYFSDKTFGLGRLWKPGNFKKQLLSYGWIIPHPACYIKKKSIGNNRFDESYKFAADFKFIIEFLLRSDIKALYLDYLFVKMKLGGLTNCSTRNIYQQNIEILSILKNANLYRGNLVFLTYKIFSRIRQILRSFFNSHD